MQWKWNCNGLKATLAAPAVAAALWMAPAGALLAADAPPAPPAPAAAPDKAHVAALIKTGQRLDRACDKAFDWLVHQQNPNGSYGRNPRTNEPYPSVGLTAMALKAIMSIPHQYSPGDGPFVTKPGDWLVSVQKESGVIVAADEKNANYETSVAIMALSKLKTFDEKTYSPAIAKAVTYIKGCQYAPADGDPKSGGIGYRAGDANVDLPNSQMFLDALHSAGYKKDSKEYKNALGFLERCQASAEVNKEAWAQKATDGGGRYNEKGVTQDKKTGDSTGGMSYSLMSSYLYLEIPNNDPRMTAVTNYVANHYNTEEHPGLGADGLYYYYVLMAQALDQYSRAGGGYSLKTADGATHAWSIELGQKLLSVQRPDSSFANAKSGKFWESDPVLCTSYSMLAMGLCFKNMEAELKSYGIELEEDD